MGESDPAVLAWKRRFERERAARKQAESLLEEKSSELYAKNERLEETTRELNLIASERQHALELALDTLERDTQKLHALSNSVPGVLCQFRREDSGEIRFDFLSKRSGEVFGFETEDALRDWRAIGIHKDDIDAFKDEIKQSALDQEDWFFEGRIVNPKGETLWWRGVGTSDLRYGEIVFSGILLDITQLRETQQILEKENIRSRELAVKAEASTQAKSRFIANMSHEMRTPLNSVLGYTQLLKLDDTLPKETREQIGVIHNSGEHLMSLINDVLEISKIEAGKVAFNRVPFNLVDLLNGVIAVFYVEARRRGLSVSWEFKSKREGHYMPEQVLSDPRILRQILVNLVGNAVKFTESGSVRIVIEELARDSRGVRIRINVFDTGVGIPADMQRMIFEEFEQLPSNKNGSGGTGLGLSISGHLIKMLGGQIRLTSTLGEGSRFYFDFYIQEVESTGSLLSLDVGEFTGYLGKRRSVLIVDDSSSSRKVVQAFLNRVDIDVDQAENGLVALEKLKVSQPDAIICDFQMPGMDGKTLCREVRKSSRFMNLPILACTGSVNEGSEEEILKDGFNGLLAKPVVATQLFQVLGEILGLEWICTTRADSGLELASRSSGGAVPDGTVLDELRSYIAVGDMASILSIAESDEMVSRYQNFSIEITKRAKAFDLGGLDEYLERLGE